ncbi:hypothetical protein KKB41_00170 [Patescibacteria group bacterium]|nr:hypothetical protein [Patescibacteria group bacterium]
MSSDRKKVHMWLWVIGVTVVIGVIWIALTNYNISAAIVSAKNSKSSNEDTLSGLKNDLKKQMEEIDKMMQDYTMEEVATSSPVATSTGEKIGEMTTFPNPNDQ